MRRARDHQVALSAVSADGTKRTNQRPGAASVSANAAGMSQGPGKVVHAA